MNDRRAQWKFLITADGSWYWEVTRPGSETRQCEKRFATLAECALDARHEGYVTCLDTPDRRDMARAGGPVRVVVAHDSEAERLDRPKLQ
jgi:hypothetical protein